MNVGLGHRAWRTRDRLSPTTARHTLARLEAARPRVRRSHWRDPRAGALFGRSTVTTCSA